mmetsp:Transcript_352/g.610  ORF Transcript_352/g.610 Transcript_352/m.610 type:complete len:87 (-) Transcript_352:30-290(-)
MRTPYSKHRRKVPTKLELARSPQVQAAVLVALSRVEWGYLVKISLKVTSIPAAVETACASQVLHEESDSCVGSRFSIDAAVIFPWH